MATHPVSSAAQADNVLTNRLSSVAASVSGDAMAGITALKAWVITAMITTPPSAVTVYEVATGAAGVPI